MRRTAIDRIRPEIRFAPDSPPEEDGFEPSVPLLRKALLGVANRRKRHERRSHLQVQVRNGNGWLEGLPIAFPFAEGPRVRIRLPPAGSLVRTWLSGAVVKSADKRQALKRSQSRAEPKVRIQLPPAQSPPTIS